MTGIIQVKTRIGGFSSGVFALPAYAAAATGDTWNPVDKAANVDLSFGNRTATSTTATAGNTRSITGRSAGKVHFEFLVVALVSNCWIGGASAATGWPGSGGTSFAMWEDGRVWYGQAGAQSLIQVAFEWRTGDVCAVEIDFDAKIWRVQNFTRGSGWSSDLDISYMTDLPWFINFSPFATGNIITLNTGQEAYSIVPTSGFGNW
jgi:hypothetical protein